MNNHEKLNQINLSAQNQTLGFAGIVPNQLAYDLFIAKQALIIDVRTLEELKFVGFVPDTLHVAWATGVSMTKNARFLKEIELKIKSNHWENKPLLLLCRSGHRSKMAATLLTQKGFTQVYNIANGFEGDLNDKNQRNQINGWRFANLPWIQD